VFVFGTEETEEDPGVGGSRGDSVTKSVSLSGRVYE
jgi:hypothetical protein